MAIINPDGSISAKLGWWRGVPGKLRITGRRLYIPAPPLKGDVPDGRRSDRGGAKSDDRNELRCALCLGTM
jgi:hypothetical protein